MTDCIEMYCPSWRLALADAAILYFIERCELTTHCPNVQAIDDVHQVPKFFQVCMFALSVSAPLYTCASNGSMESCVSMCNNTSR